MQKFYDSDKLFRLDTYRPAAMLDNLRSARELPTDGALAKALGLNASLISKVRNKQYPVTPHVLLRLHTAFDIPIVELRKMMGDS